MAFRRFAAIVAATQGFAWPAGPYLSHVRMHASASRQGMLLAGIHMDNRLETDSPQDDDGWNVDRVHILLPHGHISTRTLMSAGVLARTYQTSISI